MRLIPAGPPACFPLFALSSLLWALSGCGSSALPRVTTAPDLPLPGLAVSPVQAPGSEGIEPPPAVVPVSPAAPQTTAPRPAESEAPVEHPAPSTAPPANAHPASDAQDTEERMMLALINQHRADHGAGPLRLRPALVVSSRWQSRDMANGSYLSHTDRLGRDSFMRMAAFGYDGAGWRGENIACGNGDSSRTYLQWLNSPGHNANMLNPRYTLIGIARAYQADSHFGWYWTTDFGSD